MGLTSSWRQPHFYAIRLVRLFLLALGFFVGFFNGVHIATGHAGAAGLSRGVGGGALGTRVLFPCHLQILVDRIDRINHAVSVQDLIGRLGIYLACLMKVLTSDRIAHRGWICHAVGGLLV